jgi:hypothetical protein
MLLIQERVAGLFNESRVRRQTKANVVKESEPCVVRKATSGQGRYMNERREDDRPRGQGVDREHRWLPLAVANLIQGHSAASSRRGQSAAATAKSAPGCACS